MGELINLDEYRKNKEFKRIFDEFDQRLIELGVEIVWEANMLNSDGTCTKIGEIDF
tara:strand:- start:5319 stop:5486 length:168 start_codon:yes stop_codon:yes gene_type:complete